MIKASIDTPMVFPRARKKAKNRAVLAPIAHNMSNINGDMTANEIGWLKKCADGGFGIVITAPTQVQWGGKSWLGQPALITDQQLHQFYLLAEIIKNCGALGIVQLHHGGIQSVPSLNNYSSHSDTPPLGPSRIPPCARYPSGVREMNSKDIERVIASFVRSAVLAYRAGLDGVELHAAHNYLLCNFLNPLINQRNDEWSGTLYRRTKIVRDIIARIRAKTPRKFMIGVRLSPESYKGVKGIELENQIEAARILEYADIDYIHFSMINAFKVPNEYKENVSLTEVVGLKLASSLPVLVAGAINCGDRARRALRLGADMVSVGISAVGNPDWFKKVVSDKRLEVPPYKHELLKNNYFTDQALEYFTGISGLLECEV